MLLLLHGDSDVIREQLAEFPQVDRVDEVDRVDDSVPAQRVH